MIDGTLLNKFNQARDSKAQTKLCHAPFVSINFEQNGNMRACCYNSTEILGIYPADSVEQAWFGEKADKLRNYILDNSLEGGCRSCKEQLYAHNFQGSKIVPYDKYAQKRNVITSFFKGNKNTVEWPKVFEFEISNICNLECIMCNGYFSSAIRKNREKLPKLHSPYDERFIEQLKPFLPHLTDVKFLGGEPFLIELYYKIWDELINQKHKGKIYITTNGTVLTPKAKSYLERMDASLIISIDSLEKNNVERIRKNAKYETLIENINWFIAYSRKRKNYLTFAVCPMVSNYHELVNIVRFCNSNEILIHFNTVWYPENETLKNLSQGQVNRLLDDFSQVSFANTLIGKHNQNKVKDLISHLQYWQKENIERYSHYRNVLKSIDGLKSSVKEKELAFFEAVAEFSPEEFNFSQIQEHTRLSLRKFPNLWGDDVFFAVYVKCLENIANYELSEELFSDFKEKTDALKNALSDEKTKNQLIDILINRSNFFDSYLYLCRESKTNLLSALNTLYNVK